MLPGSGFTRHLNSGKWLIIMGPDSDKSSADFVTTHEMVHYYLHHLSITAEARFHQELKRFKAQCPMKQPTGIEGYDYTTSDVIFEEILVRLLTAKIFGVRLDADHMNKNASKDFLQQLESTESIEEFLTRSQIAQEICAVYRK